MRIKILLAILILTELGYFLNLEYWKQEKFLPAYCLSIVAENNIQRTCIISKLNAYAKWQFELLKFCTRKIRIDNEIQYYEKW